MASRRNWTGELRTAQAGGSVIECTAWPFEGVPVAYTPRKTGDPFPWALASDAGDEYRYTGRECRIRTEGDTT